MEEAEAEKSEELGPRTRRLSVRRMRQADKNNMMRDSIKEEAMLRRESMVQQVRMIFLMIVRKLWVTQYQCFPEWG